MDFRDRDYRPPDRRPNFYNDRDRPPRPGYRFERRDYDDMSDPGHPGRPARRWHDERVARLCYWSFVLHCLVELHSCYI